MLHYTHAGRISVRGCVVVHLRIIIMRRGETITTLECRRVRSYKDDQRDSDAG